MLFDSSVFLVFFGSFLLCYHFVRGSLRLRNLLLILASFVFYGYWDVRFLFLLLFTALVDFGVAMLIEDATTPHQRRRYVVVSLATNLTVLGFFKYFNFFVESFKEMAGAFGWSPSLTTLSIVLPVGISFYTFQSMGYVIDVYRGRVRACRDVVPFLAFISFFPQLVAGPIERAGHLLPQFQRPLTIKFNQVESGLWLIIVGLFKKIVVADNLDPFVDLAYRHSAPGAALILFGTLAFAIQIYCDFSGYSDIACGLASLLGFELMRNFNVPYVALNLREFWQRWHISLSTWFRDYLYIPLGGNQKGRARTYANLTVVMLLAGLWHGARLNFLLWGSWHGLGLVLNRAWSERKRPWLVVPAPMAWLLTFSWVLVGWIFFRADSMDSVYRCFTALVDLHAPYWIGSYLRNVLLIVGPVFLLQFVQARKPMLERMAFPLRPLAQAALLLIVLVYAQGAEPRPFIYFQF